MPNAALIASLVAPCWQRDERQEFGEVGLAPVQRLAVGTHGHLPQQAETGAVAVGREPIGDVLVESRVGALNFCADVRRHLRSQRIEVLLHDRALADVVLVVALEEGRERFVDGVLGGVAGQGVLATQCA
jgi:hypothetical protein